MRRTEGFRRMGRVEEKEGRREAGRKEDGKGGRKGGKDLAVSCWELSESRIFADSADGADFGDFCLLSVFVRMARLETLTVWGRKLESLRYKHQRSDREWNSLLQKRSGRRTRGGCVLLCIHF